MPSGWKNIRGGKFGKRLSGRALYHHTGKKIVRVAVDVFLSRHIVQSFLTGDQFQDIVWRTRVAGIPAREISQSQVVPEPASLVQHLPQRDDVPVRRKFWDVLAYVIIER